MNFISLQKLKKARTKGLSVSGGFTRSVKDHDARSASVLRTSRSSTAGFTLIELIVVIFIFGVISSLVIFNYGAFKSDVSVENLAQDIALTIRRAQVYSVSTKGTDAIFPSYGIHFNIPTGLAVAGNERAFVFFADVPLGVGLPGNGQYDYNTTACPISVSATDECMEIIDITSSDKITEICDGDLNRYDTTASLDIVFTRPNTEARFCLKTGGSCANPSNVTIKVQSINGREKAINIWQSGQINVK